MIWLLLLTLEAFAAPFGTVDIVTIADASGNWSRVDKTADAIRVRDGAEEPLIEGMVLDLGDVIRTTQARVQIAVGDGREFMNVGVGSEVTLKERGALQQLGDIYYQLRGAFSVQYGHVEATVEGTRFLVGAEQIEIAVAEGAVRVEDEAGDNALVQTRETTSRTAAPTPWLRKEMGPALQNTWPLGRPSVVFVASAAIGYSQRNAMDRLRISGRISPIPQLWLNATLGYASALLRFHRVPLTVGADYEIENIGVGAEYMLIYYETFFYHGPVATIRYSLPLDRHLYIEVNGRAGWVENVPWIEGGAGIGLGF